MTIQPHIAPATQADLPAISCVLDEACRWLAARGIRQWTAPFGDDYILPKIAFGEFHTIRIGEEVAGVFRLLWSDPVFWGEVADDAAYIHTLAMRRTFSGRGLGEAAIDWAADKAREQGKRYLRLDCMANNPGLNTYYSNLGFTPIGRRTVRDFEVTLFQREITQAS